MLLFKTYAIEKLVTRCGRARHCNLEHEKNRGRHGLTFSDLQLLNSVMESMFC
jgi:hypothetical protein